MQKDTVSSRAKQDSSVARIVRSRGTVRFVWSASRPNTMSLDSAARIRGRFARDDSAGLFTPKA